MKRLKTLNIESDNNQKFNAHRFSKDKQICTNHVKGLTCSSGCSNPQHAQYGYPPKYMLSFMGKPEYLNIDIFHNMVRWSTNWVNHYENNMKDDNKSGNSTKDTGSASNNNRSGTGTTRAPKQGLDDNLYPHNVLCDGHHQYSLQSCGHCYKWHKPGECVCQSPYFKKLQEDLRREDSSFIICPGPGNGHHTTCYANLHLIESSLNLVHCAIDNGAIDDFQRDGSANQPASSQQVLQWHSDCYIAQAKYLMEHRNTANPPDFVPPACP